MSRSEAVKLMNFDRSTYTNYGLGKIERSIEPLKRIVGLFCVSVDRLVYWDNNKFI